MSLIQLIYVSAAIRELSEFELGEILQSSVRHNSPLDVTGMLLYFRGSFMQVLEGEAAAVDEVYARIVQDPRHHSQFVLSQDAVGQREFSGWNMGFRRLTNEDVLANPAYAPFMAEGFDPLTIGAQPGVAMELLTRFCSP